MEGVATRRQPSKRWLSSRESPRRRSRDERFVTLSPFAIDRDEVTVGTVRRLLMQGSLTLAPTATDATHAFCTYIAKGDNRHDAWSVNCVSFALAEQACRALGKRLPTEAEWEWVAGNLSAETRFPWVTAGAETCARVDVGLGGGFAGVGVQSAACRYQPGEALRATGLPATANPEDVTELGVRRLAGGLSEWVADLLEPFTAPCWHPEQPFLSDPRCERSDAAFHVIRGASWIDPPGFVASALRQGLLEAPEGYVQAGFRCVRSMRSP